jgi:signal transduction histidine kinase
MVRVERMAAMGRIAGVVAHEINNPLQGIMLHLDLLSTCLEGNEGAQKNLRFIEGGIKRITEIVWRIINLHREKMEDESVDLNDIVRGVVMLMERQVEKSGCKLQVDCAKKLSAVYGVRALYHQAILNVVLNAMESAQKGGVISVSTRDDGESVVVEVGDNGLGIEEEDLPHIFEPFFTSKGEARPGLGLYIAHAVVTAQRGTISVESQRGKGTKVVLRFPEMTKDD